MSTFRPRLISIVVLVSACFCILIARLFEVQILKGKEYTLRSRNQSSRRSLIAARRGAISDRSGHVLAQGMASRFTAVDNKPGRMTQSEESAVCRIYPYGRLAGPVLGYVGRDGSGLGGAEHAFDEQLRGENGWSMLKCDGKNRRYNRIGMPRKPPVDGYDIRLTLDVRVQLICEKVLVETVARYGARGGMCMVMDPRTGEIIAMANAPGFNPNKWQDVTMAQRRNRCIACNYEPGSTFKVVTAASALQEKSLVEEDIIDANDGVFEIYDQVIRDHRKYDKLTFVQALSYSSNVCFAKIANDLGNARLYKYTKDFGFGAGAGIELPGEEMGIVHPVNQWSGRTLVTMAIGQEISATFLQVMAAFCAVANDGVLMHPRIHLETVDMSGRTVARTRPMATRRVISPSVARRLRRMMREVVNSGTGRQAGIAGMSICGKTGTSQKIDHETGTYSKNRVWASFIGFVPAEQPEIVCGILIDEPAYGEGGGVAAAPAFRQIVRQLVSHPELQYAATLIRTECLDTVARDAASAATRSLPDVRGMARDNASRLLSDEGIAFEVMGSGREICHQSPPAGPAFFPGARVVLYTDAVSRKVPCTEQPRVLVPDCVGRDVRDAVNVLNLKGLVPYVKGAGTVEEQEPGVGVSVRRAFTCTLTCSFDG